MVYLALWLHTLSMRCLHLQSLQHMYHCYQMYSSQAFIPFFICQYCWRKLSPLRARCTDCLNSVRKPSATPRAKIPRTPLEKLLAPAPINLYDLGMRLPLSIQRLVDGLPDTNRTMCVWKSSIQNWAILRKHTFTHLQHVGHDHFVYKTWSLTTRAVTCIATKMRKNVLKPHLASFVFFEYNFE